MSDCPYIFLLSPEIHNKKELDNFKPFQSKKMAEIIMQASEVAKEDLLNTPFRPASPTHILFGYYFWGNDLLTMNEDSKLRLMDNTRIALIDCESFSPEHSREIADRFRDIVGIFLGEKDLEKIIGLLIKFPITDYCNKRIEGQVNISINSDDILTFFLASDLITNKTKRVLRVITK